MQGFNRIVYEADRNDQKVPLPLLSQLPDLIVGLGSQPFPRPNRRHIGQQLFIRKVQCLHDRLDTGADFLRIWVPALNGKECALNINWVFYPKEWRSRDRSVNGQLGTITFFSSHFSKHLDTPLGKYHSCWQVALLFYGNWDNRYRMRSTKSPGFKTVIEGCPGW